LDGFQTVIVTLRSVTWTQCSHCVLFLCSSCAWRPDASWRVFWRWVLNL